MDESIAKGRNLRIDLARGIALLIVFSDHIPRNLVAEFTPNALGFSDMAEVFVFLSGYVCGMSYGRRLQERGFWTCLRTAVRAATRIYGAKILISAIALTLAVVFRDALPIAFCGEQWTMQDVRNRPMMTGILLVTSRLEIQHFSVLPLYILLLITLPMFLQVFRYRPRITLAASFVLYLAVQFFPANVALPSPWRSACVFNPFAWQFLFYTGAALATARQTSKQRLRPSWKAAVCAVVLLDVSIAISAMTISAPNAGTLKSTLGSLRLLHFATIVVFGWWAMPSSVILGRSTFLHPIILCGQNPLVTYCTGGILAIVGDAVFRAMGNGIAWQAVVNVVGWVGCVGMASLCNTIRMRSRDASELSTTCDLYAVSDCERKAGSAEGSVDIELELAEPPEVTQCSDV
jgi:hypothetical protein